MRFRTLLFIFLVFALLPGCIQQQATGPTAEKVTASFKAVDSEGAIILDKSVEAEKGANAFEEMKKIADLDYTMYSIGPFIEEIEGVAPTGAEYWALYVNGEYAGKGIADYTLDEDTVIEWRIESLEST